MAVVIFQDPQAEWVCLSCIEFTPVLGSLMSAGHKVALVTDGRMSGASGKVPAALHVSPEVAWVARLGKCDGGRIECTYRRIACAQSMRQRGQRINLNIADSEASKTMLMCYGRDLFVAQRRG